MSSCWEQVGCLGRARGPPGSRPGSARMYPVADAHPAPLPLRRFHGRHELAPAMPSAHRAQREGPRCVSMREGVSESERGGMFLCE